MSLPWFPFHIDKFLSDTLALDGEAIGAYVLLMLHYYATETPPRDNDRALATIARLPIKTWKERRPEIEALFQIRDGAWHHPTIEAQMADAKAKHAMVIARTSAAGQARWANRPPKAAPSKSRVVPKASPELTLSNARAMHDALPEQSPSSGESTITESLSVDVLTVDKDNSGDNSDTTPGPDEAGDQEESLGTLIDSAFRPYSNHLAACHFDGADEETVDREIAGFIATHQERGTFSHDWGASWTMWWKRWKDHRDAQAKKAAPKPRIEVSNTIDWDAHAKRWHGGMGWPRGVGPDPSSPACRCPPEILAKHATEKV